MGNCELGQEVTVLMYLPMEMELLLSGIIHSSTFFKVNLKSPI